MASYLLLAPQQQEEQEEQHQQENFAKLVVDIAQWVKLGGHVDI